jgi:hypothetical protein
MKAFCDCKMEERADKIRGALISTIAKTRKGLPLSVSRIEG